MNERSRRDHGTLRLLGIIGERHLPGKHDQSSHGRPGAVGVVKAGAEKITKKGSSAAAVKAAVKKAVADVEPAKPPRPAKAPRKAAVKPAAPPTHQSPRPAVPAKSSSARESQLRKRLAAIDDEAAPIRELIGKMQDSKRVHSTNENIELYRKQARLKKLREEADPLARELLDVLSERDGSPFGGNPGDGPPAARPGLTTRRTGKGGAGAWKQRDRYVMQDQNTITQNASLRTGDPTPAAQRWAADMRRMVRSSEMEQDTTVFRGAAMPPDVVMSLRPGAVIHDRGMVSTDASRDQALFYGGERQWRTPGAFNTLFEIRVPAGTPAMDVGVGEIVLDHDNDFRIVSSRMDGDTVHVVMELVGSSP